MFSRILSFRSISRIRQSTRLRSSFFADQDFASLGLRSPVLLKRLEKHIGLTQPTAVQAQAIPKLLDPETGDVTIGAETGSGKTLAYLLPLMDDILSRREENDYDYARAIILVPNKELVQQVARMALILAGGPDSLVFGSVPMVEPPSIGDDSSRVRIALLPGGLKEPTDFPPFRASVNGDDAPVDLVVTTPASLGPLALAPKNIDLFADVKTLVVDEADMLLDGGYLKPLEQVFLGFRRADRLNLDAVEPTQHVFVAATLPDYGLRSVDAYLQKKFPDAERIALSGMHQARHFGLVEATEWHALESKRDRLQTLVSRLDSDLKDEKIMIFCNSVEDAEGSCQALQRAGHPAVAYHAKVPLDERTKLLADYRAADSGLLVCTDLAARGLDVPGVSVVVQLQFAGNVVAHLHRMGRCGRAGQRTGRGLVFYDEHETALVEEIRRAESVQERMQLEQDVEGTEEATVKKAFSRKRGFTKKRKKQRD